MFTKCLTLFTPCLKTCLYHIWRLLCHVFEDMYVFTLCLKTILEGNIAQCFRTCLRNIAQCFRTCLRHVWDILTTCLHCACYQILKTFYTVFEENSIWYCVAKKAITVYKWEILSCLLAHFVYFWPPNVIRVFGLWHNPKKCVSWHGITQNVTAQPAWLQLAARA